MTQITENSLLIRQVVVSVRLNRSGFTIVELLIVIVVIGILAAITVVAFNGVQDRAKSTALQSDLKNAAKLMNIAQVDSSDETYPTSLPSEVKTSPGNILQLTQTGNPKSYCINGYGPSNKVMSYSSASSSARPYLCSGATIGSAVGGNPPTAPRNVNLVSDFSTWSLSGGVTYNSSTNELQLNNTAGSATSPLVRIDGSSNARLTVDSYATLASPIGTPNSQVYFSSFYYGADGATAATSSAGWVSNGNAQNLPLSSWGTYTWTTATGPTVIYVKFVIHSDPSGRTSDNRYRNPSIMGV